jgi:GH15 family glucan-1,4-alpha-glucosidase
MAVEGKGFAWWNDPAWEMHPTYEPETLVSDSTVSHRSFGVQVNVRDFVHPIHNILVRQFTFRSNDRLEKKVRCFFHHDFHLYGDNQKDTAFYEPYTNAVIHYREKRYVLVGAQTDSPSVCAMGLTSDRYAPALRSMEKLRTCGITQFSIGKANYRGLEGTWRDAEDGELTCNPIEQGSVDSTVRIDCIVPSTGTATVTLWMCMGKDMQGVLGLQQTILEETPERLYRNTRNYWKSWANKVHRSFGELPSPIVEQYKRSLLTIRAHMDNGGGILAAADSDIMEFNRDTYTYVWPRDGAFVSLSMDAAGYGEATKKFFEFCARVQTPDGYLQHKYNPDGSVGSSWHPWYRDGHLQLPIQEDETALPLYALWQHFEHHQDFEFLQTMFESFVKRAAQFLVDFREPQTGLPLASYDPWEERRGVFTYTAATVAAGLRGAAHIAHILGHHQHSERYQTAADEVRQALLFHLFDEEKQSFMKYIVRKDGKTVERYDTPDASIGAVWQLGILPPDDPRMISTMERLARSVTVQTPVGGLARYPGDRYHAGADTSEIIPGNPWIITTLWQAQWKIARAQTKEELRSIQDTLLWAVQRASSSGLLPEQLHPVTGKPLSVSPLTWSHAVFVDTVLQYLKREAILWTL